MLAALTIIVVLETTLSVQPISIQEFLASPVPQEAHNLTGQELVDFINSRQEFFQAKYTPISDQLKTLVMPRKFMGSVDGKDRVQMDINVELPKKFDAREQWPKCKSISDIRDQSRCGSCWAVSAASAASDRMCIQTQSRVQDYLSDEDLLACCGSFCGEGCRGGALEQAWQYIMLHGLCTGGLYEAKDVCKPYSLHPCGNHKDQIYYGPCSGKSWDTPRCKRFCRRGYSKNYKDDKIYAKTTYLLPNDEKAIRNEIMTNGPVQAGFDVYSDFHLYRKGIYVHPDGEFTPFGHAVKIIGWGTENGTDYWLIANSWNNDWGEDGYFRMIRGVNNCKIEEEVYAGIMDI